MRFDAGYGCAHRNRARGRVEVLVIAAELEHRHRAHQVFSLRLEAAGGCGHFLHQRGVLLCHLVHLLDGFTHLRYACGLLVAGRADLAHEVGDAADRAHHFGHGHAGFVYQSGALFDTLHTGVDEGLDFFGRFGTAPG